MQPDSPHGSLRHAESQQKAWLAMSFLQVQPMHLLASKPAHTQPEPQGLASPQVSSVKVGRTSFRVQALPPSTVLHQRARAALVAAEAEAGEGRGSTHPAGEALVEDAVRAGKGAAVEVDAAAAVAAKGGCQRRGAGRGGRAASHVGAWPLRQASFVPFTLPLPMRSSPALLALLFCTSTFAMSTVACTCRPPPLSGVLHLQAAPAERRAGDRAPLNRSAEQRELVARLWHAQRIDEVAGLLRRARWRRRRQRAGDVVAVVPGGGRLAARLGVARCFADDREAVG